MGPGPSMCLFSEADEKKMLVHRPLAFTLRPNFPTVAIKRLRVL